MKIIKQMQPLLPLGTYCKNIKKNYWPEIFEQHYYFFLNQKLKVYIHSDVITNMYDFFCGT